MMKRTVAILVAYILLMVKAYGQCSVTIVPQGNTILCPGDSVTLNTVTSGGGMLADQSSLLYNGGTSARNLPGYSTWQSFTAGLTGTLSQVDLGFFNYINGTSTMIVYQGSGTYGPVLDNHQISVFCPAGNCILSFPLSIPVTAGQKYTVRVIPGLGMPDPYGVQVGVPGPYSGGKFGLVDPSGTDTSNGFDWVFRTYVGNSLSYAWSNGSTGTGITVSSGGQYMVTVTDSMGCTAADTMMVTSAPGPAVHLGNDTTICTGCSLTLYAGPGFSSYDWSTGQTTASIIVNTAGTYWVEVTDDNGCSGADTITVHTETVGMGESPMNVFNVIVDQQRGSLIIQPASHAVEEFTVTLYDLVGRQVYSQRFKGVAVADNSTLPGGIYVLNVACRDAQLCKRIAWAR